MVKRRAGNGTGDLIPVGNLVTPKLRRQLRAMTGPTPIQRRLIDTAALNVEQPDLQTILYQHTVFCQTSLPYRNPGDEARTWERINGDVHLKVLAGEAMHPDKGRLVEVGLPFGPKCRMVLMHINQRALVTESPHVEVEDTLSKFVRNVLQLDSRGSPRRRSVWASCATVTRSQSIRRSSRPLMYGSPKTTASAFCGPPRCHCRSTTSRAS